MKFGIYLGYNWDNLSLALRSECDVIFHAANIDGLMDFLEEHRIYDGCYVTRSIYPWYELRVFTQGVRGFEREILVVAIEA